MKRKNTDVYEISTDEVYILSDVHLGREDSKVFEAFLIDLYKDSLVLDRNATLILNGDIFDMWHTSFYNIYKKEKSVFNLLFMFISRILPRVRIVYVLGNHDLCLEESVEVFRRRGIDVYNMFSFVHEGRRFDVMHGHEFEALTYPSPEAYYNLCRKIPYFSPLLKFFKQPHMNDAKNVMIKELAEKFAHESSGCSEDSFLVYGHTHKAGHSTGRYGDDDVTDNHVIYNMDNHVINTGVFYGDKATYLKITKDAVELKPFRSQSFKTDPNTKQVYWRHHQTDVGEFLNQPKH